MKVTLKFTKQDKREMLAILHFQNLLIHSFTRSNRCYSTCMLNSILCKRARVRITTR